MTLPLIFAFCGWPLLSNDEGSQPFPNTGTSPWNHWHPLFAAVKELILKHTPIVSPGLKGPFSEPPLDRDVISISLLTTHADDSDMVLTHISNEPPRELRLLTAI